MLEIGTSKNPQGFLFFSFSAFLRPGLSARSYKISCYDIFWPSARIFQKLAKNLPLKSSLFGTRVTMSLEVQCSFKATRNVVTFRFLSALHPQDPSKTPSIHHPPSQLQTTNPTSQIFQSSRVISMFLDLPSIPSPSSLVWPSLKRRSPPALPTPPPPSSARRHRSAFLGNSDADGFQRGAFSKP